MEPCRLFSPPPWLPFYLLPVWPLIWWRICRVREWFRAVGGPGAGMIWSVDIFGRVHVLAVSDEISGRGGPHLNVPPPSRGFLNALKASDAPGADGDFLPVRPGAWPHVPVFAGICALHGEIPLPDT